MINPFTAKKYLALILCVFLPTVIFMVLQTYYNLIYGLLGYGVAGLFLIIISIFLLRNPFTDLIENKGIIVLNVDSTGIIDPFIVTVRSPFIHGKYQGKEVVDVFDRYSVFQMKAPKMSKSGAIDDGKGSITFTLDEKSYNKGRFSLYSYPTLLWNNQINSLITKDWLSDQEKTFFAEHSIIYIKRRLEELNGYMRDFSRYVVELTRPKGKGLLGGSNVAIIIIIIAGIILLLLFGPTIYNVIVQSTQTSPSASAIVGADKPAIVQIPGLG